MTIGPWAYMAMSRGMAYNNLVTRCETGGGEV